MNPALEGVGRSGGRGRWILQVVDHLHRAVQFLLGDEEGGIDVERLLEQGDGIVEFAVVAQLLTTMDDGGGGFEAGAFKGRAIAQIPGFKVVSLLEEVVGRLVLLAGELRRLDP